MNLAVTIKRSGPDFCESNGQQVVRISLSFSELNADNSSSGFLVATLYQVPSSI